MISRSLVARCAACRPPSVSYTRQYSVIRASSGAQASTSSSPEPDGTQADKWESVLQVHHTLSSLYTVKQPAEIPWQQLDHNQRRRARDLQEICEAGKKLGLSETHLRANVLHLESLLPDLTPDLNRMKASEWAKLLHDVNKAALVVIAMRRLYPKANVSAIVARVPRLLLQDVAALEQDAQQVKQMLAPVPDSIDAIIEAVPYLMSPVALTQSLANLRAWFPSSNPLQVLQENPSLLLNIGEADLDADPLYGELTTAG